MTGHPDELERCVRDERWGMWMLWFFTDSKDWAVFDRENAREIGYGKTALEAAQAALQTRGDK